MLARRRGATRDIPRDLYHALIAMPWYRFLPLQGLVFGTISFAFALLYWLPGDAIKGARPGSLADAFFFRVQTLGTIGYGGMTPQGNYANILVCIQAYVGLVSIAMMSGLAFAKFSIPQTRVMFSQTMVAGRRNGVPVLQFRLANARGNQIVEARLGLTMARTEVTAEGERLRRLLRLPLIVPETPIFALSFMATHLMDESSPLHGWRDEEFRRANVEFIATMIGTDDTLSQQVHARHAYGPEDVAWDQRFVETLFVASDGVPVLDLTLFHATEPLQVASSSQ